MRQWMAGALAAVLMAGQASVADPPPFPQFEAKRVTPPGAGASGRRITVQIDPVAQAAARAEAEAERQAEAADESAIAAPVGRYTWFWNAVSPDIGQANIGRIDNAMNALAGARDPVRVPRLDTLQEIARKRGVDILRSTVGTQVSPALVLAVISVESAGRAEAVSPAGAQGLMQLIPATAARFDVTDSFDPAANIAGGVAYLDWLMREFDGDPILVLAGYNAGEGAVRKYQGVPPYPETRDYVPKVLATYQLARGLCITPPLLASDGCVFAALN